MPLDPYQLETNYPPILDGGIPGMLYSHALSRASSEDILGANEHTYVGGRGILAAQRRAALFRQQQAALQQGSKLQAESLANMMAGAKTMAGQPVTDADRRAFASTASFATRMLGPAAMNFAAGQRILDDLSPGKISPLNIAMATATAGSIIRDPVTGSQQLGTGTTSHLSSAMFRAMVNNPTDPVSGVVGIRPSYGQTGMQIGRNFAYMASQGLLGDSRLPVLAAINSSTERAVAAGFDPASITPNAADTFGGALAGFGSPTQVSLGASVAAIRAAGITSPAAYEQFMQDARAAEITRQTEFNQAKATQGLASVKELGETVDRAALVGSAETPFEQLEPYERELRLLELAAVGAKDLAFNNPERAKEMQKTYQAYRTGDTEQIMKTAFSGMTPDEQLSFVTSIVPNLEKEDAVKIVERLTPTAINPASPGGAPGLDLVKDPFGVATAEAITSKPNAFDSDPRTKAVRDAIAEQMAQASAMFNSKMSAIDGILKDSGMDEFLEDVEEKSKLLQTMMSGAGGQVSDARASEFLQLMRAAGRRNGLTATELSQAGMMGTSIVKAYGLDRDMSLLATTSLMQSATTLGRSGFSIDKFKTFGARSEAELNAVNATITAGAIASREGNVLATVLRATELGNGGVEDGSEESRTIAALQKRADGRTLNAAEQTAVDKFLSMSESEQLGIASRVTGVRSNRLADMVDEDMANQELMSRRAGAAALADRQARLQSRDSDLQLNIRQRMQSVGSSFDDTNNTYFTDIGTDVLMGIFDTSSPGEYRNDSDRDGKFAALTLQKIVDDARAGNADAVAMAKSLGLDLMSDDTTRQASPAYKKAKERLTKLSRAANVAGPDSLADQQALLGRSVMAAQELTAAELADETRLAFALSDTDRLETLPEVLASVGATGTSDKDLTLVSAAARAVGHDISGESQAILSTANARILEAVERRRKLTAGGALPDGTTKEEELSAIEKELTEAKSDVRSVMAREQDNDRKIVAADAAWASGQETADSRGSGAGADSVAGLRSMNVGTLNLNVNGGEVIVKGTNAKSSPEAPVQ